MCLFFDLIILYNYINSCYILYSELIIIIFGLKKKHVMLDFGLISVTWYISSHEIYLPLKIVASNSLSPQKHPLVTSQLVPRISINLGLMMPVLTPCHVRPSLSLTWPLQKDVSHIWAMKENPYYFPLYWLVTRDPYNGLLSSLYTWVV